MTDSSLQYILVVEDHPDWGASLKQMYEEVAEQSGLHPDVLWATDADSAVKILKASQYRHRIGLLSADLNLGQLSPDGKLRGYSAVSLIDEVALDHDYQRRMAIVVFSARASDRDLSEALPSEDFKRALNLEDWLEERRPNACMIREKKLIEEENINSPGNIRKNIEILTESLKPGKLHRLIESSGPGYSIEEQLVYANSIQKRLLPQEMPKISGYDAFGLCRPAGAIGGDFFDVFPTNNGGIAICVADIKGKGLPAAILASTIQALVHANVSEGEGPGRCLNAVHKHLVDFTDVGEFATAFVGVLDTETHTLRFANAAHPSAYLAPLGEEPRHLEPLGPPIGLLSEATYIEGEVGIAPGDLVFVVSDGVIEAENTREEDYGEEKLLRSVGNLTSLSPEELVKGVYDSVTEFQGPHQYDDITILALRRDERP